MQNANFIINRNKKSSSRYKSIVAFLFVGFILSINSIGTREFDRDELLRLKTSRIPSASESQGLVSSADLNVLTWNIQYGSDNGERSNRWNKRKKSLETVLPATSDIDILCIQEGMQDQLRFINELFPEFDYLGNGREDGAAKGEFCAIYFDRKRLELIKSDTFWLSDTPSIPSITWGNFLPRICTWARFKDKNTDKTVRVYNTHFPLTGNARRKAAVLIAEHIAADPHEPVILAGDLNSGPGSIPWKTFNLIGLQNVNTAGDPTYHFRGFGIRCLDAIMIGNEGIVRDYEVIREKGKYGYPSDHFGIRTTVAFNRVRCRVRKQVCL